MNKLIKSAMMMASVGAMLCIVGCGEITPKEQLTNTLKELHALVTQAGGNSKDLAGLITKLEAGEIPEPKIIEMMNKEGKLINDNISSLREYVDAVAKATTALKAAGAREPYYIKPDKVSRDLEQFCKKSKDDQVKLIKKAIDYAEEIKKMMK